MVNSRKKLLQLCSPVDVDDFVVAKTTNFNRSQQGSTSRRQVIQQKLLGIKGIPKRSEIVGAFSEDGLNSPDSKHVIRFQHRSINKHRASDKNTQLEQANELLTSPNARRIVLAAFVGIAPGVESGS
jgi:hypothetical protein